MKKIHKHFSRIAPRYDDLRTTDAEPVLFIRKKLRHSYGLLGADIGCGSGRYDVKLLNLLGDTISLICIDRNEDMLNALLQNLKKHKIKRPKTIMAAAGALPLAKDSLDVAFTFNAVHHFEVLGFLREISRVLREGGYLFVYTRLRSQNRKSIWGRFFPSFYEKETRLYEMGELKRLFLKVPKLQLESVEYFKYRRTSDLEWLVVQARNRHYSTFNLYKQKEFTAALNEFRKKIADHFDSLNNVVWYDENVMFLAKKRV